MLQASAINAGCPADRLHDDRRVIDQLVYLIGQGEVVPVPERMSQE